MIENLKDIAPLIAIGISILAIIVSTITALNSRRTSKLALKQFQSKQSNFEVYLVDSYSTKINDDRFLFFHITITNKADSKNSFQPNLIVEHIDSENYLTKLQLPHLPEKSDIISKKKLSFFPKQISLNEKESSSKWLIFTYNMKTLGKNRIDNYIISLKDVNGVEQSVKSSLIKNYL